MNPTVVVKDPPRIVYADMLRLVAIFFVVLIHACTLYMYDYNLNLRIWSQTLIFDSFSRWCLPIFFMLSGMFLLNPKKEESLSNFYKKRFATVLIPFITWTIIYAFRKSDVEGELSVLSAFKVALSGPIYYHLWFVYTLVGLYLITPVIRIFVKHASDTELKYFLSLWFVFNSLVAILQNHFHISIGFDLSYFTGYLGFFVLGYYLHTAVLSKKATRLVYMLGVLGLLVTLGGNYLFNYKDHFMVDQSFYTYLNFGIILTSASAFLLFKNSNDSMASNSLVMKVVGIKNLSRIIFGIYLVHPIFIEILKSSSLGLDSWFRSGNVFVVIPVVTLAVFFASLCLFLLVDWLYRRFSIFKVFKLFY